MLICPVCGNPLEFQNNVARCSLGHCFDVAREGYVNLLRSSKSGDLIGDDKASARCRRDFLNKGYYASLKDALCQLFGERKQDSYRTDIEDCMEDSNLEGIDRL